jgi:hypothetical protein
MIQFELPIVLPGDSGEGPLSVTKKGALHRLSGNRWRVACDEGFLNLTAFSGNKASQQSLTCSAFTGNQNSGRQPSYLPDHVIDYLHLGTFANEKVVLSVLIRLCLQIDQLSIQDPFLHNAVGQIGYFIIVKIFGDVVISSQFHSLKRYLHVSDSGDHNRFNVVVALFGLLRNLQTINPRQSDI